MSATNVNFTLAAPPGERGNAENNHVMLKHNLGHRPACAAVSVHAQNYQAAGRQPQ